MPEKPLADLEDLVGETYTVVERFPIEAGKIAEFAEAIGDDNPLYLDTSGETARQRGYDDVPAPITFPMASSFFKRRQDMGERPDLGFDRTRIVHGEEAFEYDRVPVAGDVLTGEERLADVYQREGGRGGTMTFAEWETTYTDRDDDRVLQQRQTIIELGGGDEG